MNAVQFGFLKDASTITWERGASKIEPLSDQDEIVADLQREESLLDGWFYPPLRPVKSSRDTPLVAAGFALPATHQLQLSSETVSDEEANFTIALFGLLKGQRLQRPDWQHFYKAPVESRLNDFLATDEEIERALDIATDFWRRHSPAVCKLAFGALHWHLFAQLYEHEFERFNAQYMALDACAELAFKIQFPRYPARRPPHAIRASKLCSCTGVPKPTWVDATIGQTSCDLAQRRNALAHEAMYGGQPVGFAYPTDHPHMELELTGLVARIFLRLVGISNEYTKSPCTTGVVSAFGLPAQ